MTNQPPLPPETPPEPAPARRPWPLIVGLVVLALVVLAGGGWWWLNQHGASPAPATAAAPRTLAAPGAAPAALPPGAIAGQPDTVYEWSQDKAPNGVTYVIDGVTVRVWAEPDTEGSPVPTYEVTAPGGATLRGSGAEAFQNAAASFAVGRLDPSSPLPQVLFMTFTGGAHCCADIRALEVRDGRWREVQLGMWDGGPPEEYPRDVDGDGRPELVMYDNRFLYAFASYADSRAPAQVVQLREGKAVDVSADPRYRALYEAELPDFRADCVKGENAACAAYVAAAARLDRFDEAWAVMMRSHDPDTDWLPSACRIETARGCPDDQKVEFGSFPEALRWFLGDAGYTPPVPLPPAG